ncbi:uncharacterized protein [Acropora muricata]|uniref:uncharacterized protein isoform X1 n=1 Tax=Acropora muricata TaxID=159855 RepID=UPI0034E56933
MAMRARAYYSADEVSRLLWEENDDSELESGTSEEEEAELEHQLGIFGEESSEDEAEDDNIEDSSVAGSQSSVCITDTFTFTTSATTTTATPGLVVATFSPLVSFPVATQEAVAGPSCSFSGGSFYSTRQRTPVLAKRAWVEPPKRPQKLQARKAVAKMVKIKGGGEMGKEPAAAAVGCSLSYHDSDVGNPLPAFTPRREPGFHLRIQNTLVSPLDFFQLYFMPVLVDEIVQHTNAYAYIEVAKENSNKRCNTECDGSW